MTKLSLFVALILVTCLYIAFKQPQPLSSNSININSNLRTGAEQTEKYLPYLKGKRIGILGNQTSVISKTHLVDSLKARGVTIVKVFGPEHGFRGNASKCI